MKLYAYLLSDFGYLFGLEVVMYTDGGFLCKRKGQKGLLKERGK